MLSFPLLFLFVVACGQLLVSLFTGEAGLSGCMLLVFVWLVEGIRVIYLGKGNGCTFRATALLPVLMLLVALRTIWTGKTVRQDVDGESVSDHFSCHLPYIVTFGGERGGGVA